MTAAIGVDDGFRLAMRRLASGVAIVTARSGPTTVGMAATSITSVTMAPPTILVCVNRSAGLHACLDHGCPLGINLLSRSQREVAVAFGGAVPRDRRFAVGRWTDDGDRLPTLDDAQASLACTIDRLVRYGTHSIVIARVDAVRLSAAIDPLIYQDGAYA